MNRPDPQSCALITAGAINTAVVLFLPPPLFVWLLVADLLAGCAALGALYLGRDAAGGQGGGRELRAAGPGVRR